MYFVLYFGVVIVYIRQHKPLRKGLEALLACENASAQLLALHSCIHVTSAPKPAPGTLVQARSIVGWPLTRLENDDRFSISVVGHRQTSGDKKRTIKQTNNPPPQTIPPAGGENVSRISLPRARNLSSNNQQAISHHHT